MWRALTLALVLTACAASADQPPPSTSTTTGSTTTNPPASTTQPAHGRDAAPDFTLALHEGGAFTLSETTKPVYLVFWAEWCPTCRHELPVVDAISADYADRIDFVAPVWKSGEDAAITAAAELFPSGRVMWGLDPDEVIFELYGVPYQPVTVLIGADGTVVDAWAGIRSESEIRSALDELLNPGG